MNLAKQSTAKTILIGPVLDADGVAVTSLTASSFKITKNGTVGDLNASSTVTHNHTGHYLYAANGGDLDTLGVATISINSTTNGMAPVSLQVVPANVYDSFIGGSDYLQVDAVQQGGTTLTARDIGASVLLSSGTGTGQISLSSGIVKADIDTIKTQAVTCAAGVTVLSSVGTAATSTAQTGDSFARIGATGSGLTSLAQASVCTETRLSELDAGTAGKMANQVDVIQTDTTTDIPATITTMQGNVTSILGDTEDIQTQIGIAGAGLTAINLPDQTMNITGNITGNISGSVGSVTGNVGGTVARVTLVDTCTSNTDMLTAAAVNAEVDSALNTAIPATPTTASINDYIKKMKIELVNAKDINAAGDSIPYDDAGSALSTVSAAYSLDSTTVKRKKLL